MNRLFLIVILILCGCISPEEQQKREIERAQREAEKSLIRKSLSTREFEMSDKSEMLKASTGVLQDLGFILQESDERLGLLVGSKERSAADTTDIVMSTLITALVIAATDTYQSPTYDSEQEIFASLVVRPKKDRMVVRVSFFRKVWRTDGSMRTELMEEGEMYQKFFAKLSKAVFLEGHKI